MYVPPYQAILKKLNATKEQIDRNERISVPGQLLKELLKMAVAQCDFDEEDYLRQNPDVGAAVQSGKVDSGWDHFIGFGYFEGRRGGMPVFDEAWYLRRNPDVSAAVDSGALGSAVQHFYSVGGVEGRSPNREVETEAQRWKNVMQRLST
jgi:hypothetical protein